MTGHFVNQYFDPNVKPDYVLILQHYLFRARPN